MIIGKHNLELEVQKLLKCILIVACLVNEGSKKYSSSENRIPELVNFSQGEKQEITYNKWQVLAYHLRQRKKESILSLNGIQLNNSCCQRNLQRKLLL